jgi:long-subunit acyl-CoA synthetase (AMP-forming)
VHLRASLPDEDPRTSLADLCANPKVKALVLKECNASGKKSGFKGIEMLQAVILTADEWTPESGLVTAAQKLQRKKIAQRYDAEISVRFFPYHLVVSCAVIGSHARALALSPLADKPNRLQEAFGIRK